MKSCGESQTCAGRVDSHVAVSLRENGRGYRRDLRSVPKFNWPFCLALRARGSDISVVKVVVAELDLVITSVVVGPVAVFTPAVSPEVVVSVVVEEMLTSTSPMSVRSVPAAWDSMVLMIASPMVVAEGGSPVEVQIKVVLLLVLSVKVSPEVEAVVRVSLVSVV